MGFEKDVSESKDETDDGEVGSGSAKLATVATAGIDGNALPRGPRPAHWVSNGGERLVFTVPEAGELLGVSRAFAYELAARGVLPIIRLGRRIVVPRAAFLEMVDSASGAD